MVYGTTSVTTSLPNPIHETHFQDQIVYELKNSSYLSRTIRHETRIVSLEDAQILCSKIVACGGITKYGSEYDLRFGNIFQDWLIILKNTLPFSGNTTTGDNEIYST